MSNTDDHDLMSAPPRHLLGRFRQAMLDSSPDALADLFSPDAIYEFPFLAPQRETQRYDGREQIRAGFTRAWEPLRPSPLTLTYPVPVRRVIANRSLLL